MATIKERREWASAAIAVYRERTNTEQADAISDLVCDLMHLAKKYKQDELHAIERGISHWYAETNNERMADVSISLFPR